MTYIIKGQKSPGGAKPIFMFSSQTRGTRAGGRGSRVLGGDYSGRALEEGTIAWKGVEDNSIWLVAVFLLVQAFRS
jgi:hypothetical protein